MRFFNNEEFTKIVDEATAAFCEQMGCSSTNAISKVIADNRDVTTDIQIRIGHNADYIVHNAYGIIRVDLQTNGASRSAPVSIIVGQTRAGLEVIGIAAPNYANILRPIVNRNLFAAITVKAVNADEEGNIIDNNTDMTYVYHK